MGNLQHAGLLPRSLVRFLQGFIGEEEDIQELGINGGLLGTNQMEQTCRAKCHGLWGVGRGGKTLIPCILCDRLGEIETDFVKVDNLAKRNDLVDSDLVVLENTDHAVNEGLVALNDMLLLAFTQELLAGNIEVEIDHLSIEFANRLLMDMNG